MFTVSISRYVTSLAVCLQSLKAQFNTNSAVVPRSTLICSHDSFSKQPYLYRIYVWPCSWKHAVFCVRYERNLLLFIFVSISWHVM
jgi:hypothetical protein